MHTFLKRLFSKRTPPKSYYQVLFEIEEKRNILLQEFENKKIERGIKCEGLRLFNEWFYAPMIKIGDKEFKNPPIFIIKPFITCLMIYHEETAKYKNANIGELIKEEYNRLRESALSKTTPELK